MSLAWKGGTTRRWAQQVRPVVLERNRVERGGVCELAYQGTWLVVTPAGKPEERRCTKIPTQVHHTLGRAITGDDPRYLVATCRNCNLRAGDPSKAGDPVAKPVSQWD